MMRSVSLSLLSVVALVAGAPGVAHARKAANRTPPLCVQRSTLTGPVVRKDGQVYFRGQPDWHKSFIARFKGQSCQTVNPLAILRVEADGNRICEGDKISVVMNPAQIAGPRCVIDRLVPFSGDVDDPLPAGGL